MDVAFKGDVEGRLPGQQKDKLSDRAREREAGWKAEWRSCPFKAAGPGEHAPEICGNVARGKGCERTRAVCSRNERAGIVVEGWPGK